MHDRNNTIAGWALFAGVVALGASLVSGEVFKSHDVESGGYPVAGGEESEGGAAEAEKPIAFYLASGDAAKGEAVFKKCAACHNADQGGANALGPALYGTMGKAVAGHAGFAYSDALKGVGGTWNWDNMSAWLASPKKFAPGTKMTFAGLGNPQDRANVIAYLNSMGTNLPLPAAPAAAAPAEGDKAAAEAAGADAQKADDQPVLDNTAAAQGGGEAKDQPVKN